MAFAQTKEQRDQKLLALQEENVVTVEQVLTNYLTQAYVVHRMQDVTFALDQTQDEKYAGWMSLIKSGEIDQFLKCPPLNACMDSRRSTCRVVSCTRPSRLADADEPHR